MTDNDKNLKPATYPRPTETDKQLKDQPEYIDQQPNDFDERKINDAELKKGDQETKRDE